MGVDRDMGASGAGIGDIGSGIGCDADLALMSAEVEIGAAVFADPR